MLKDRLCVDLRVSESPPVPRQGASQGTTASFSGWGSALTSAAFLFLLLFAQLSASAQCSNVTYPGEIVGNEQNCAAFDPAPIGEQFAATGGSGALEYLWLASTSGCPSSLNDAIPDSWTLRHFSLTGNFSVSAFLCISKSRSGVSLFW